MSWIEVESKVRVDDLPEARKRIKKIAKYVKTEKKIDDYYSLNPLKGYPKKSLRVRDKGRKCVVNFKQRIWYKDGVWAKKEVEFGISDIDNFHDLLKEFGFIKWMRKEKKTELYKTKEGVMIELNYVKKLGWFIELEVLCKENEMKDAAKRINKIRKLLNIKKEEIEKKGYTKLLWHLGK